MAESSSEPKRVKPAQNDDRISSLPDAVLLHILSFLPTQISVRTSLLSRTWRHLWKHLEVFDFDDDDWELHHYDEVIDIRRGFAAFVNAVLVLRRSRDIDIRTFRLKCAHEHSNSFGGKSVATWVRAAIGPHLEELHLTLDCDSEHVLELPHDLFICTNLKSLNVRGGIQVQVPSTVRLLSLKTLYLHVNSVDFIDLLLSGCPVLETLDLCLTLSGMNMVHKVTVPSTLKKLTFKVADIREVNLEIYAPSLEYLNLDYWSLGLPSSISVEIFHNMMEANLDMFVTDQSLLFMLLGAICRTKTLILSLSTIECLLLAPSLELPQFHYLVHLELILPWFNSSFLLTMLQQCNVLQALNIDIQKCKGDPVRETWSQPKSVPDCLVSHLNFFKFEVYEGNEHELAFVGYILRNGLVLETMAIHDYVVSLEKRHQIHEELSVMPRGSNICQLRFIDRAIYS